MMQLANDKEFLYELDKIWEKFTAYVDRKEDQPCLGEEDRIAYFTMEYGLHLTPNYAGGLGMLAGDILKGASDLSIPMTGVSLFYKYGYFRQRLNINGEQEEIYDENNIFFLPVTEVKSPQGEPAYVTVDILNTPVRVKLWSINVGKVELILLDTDLEGNPPLFRTITDYLYVADRDKRIMQEIILGLGGMRALQAIDVHPQVYHLNEGHSAFLILERLRNLVTEQNYSIDKAYALIKSSTVFTTHTPIEAGNEKFSTEMVKKYLEKDIKSLNIPVEQFLEFGFLHDKKTFWLPALAIRFSQYINGVSKIHSQVSKKMWKDLFPRRMILEIPIINITNGVHYSWLSNEMRSLFDSYLGPEYIYSGDNEEIWGKIDDIPDSEVWDAHIKRKGEMIAFIRRTMMENYVAKGFSPDRIKKAQELLNINHFTIAFARRFATYKRPNLILKDKERLRKILTNPEKPVQIIFAGKAHPADIAGKSIIKEIIDFAREYEVEDRVIFLENYDREIAAHLVQGVDVWLNNPVKPNEASGTSGMKAGINGVLNLSVLDGWWPECYNKKNGWAITAGEIYENADMRDLAETNQVYELLEKSITDMYYERDDRNIPQDWVKLMKESIHSVIKQFNINRMITEYCKKFYQSSVKNYSALLGDNKKLLGEVVGKYKKIKTFWDKIRIKDVYSDFDRREILLTDETIHYECYVYLDGADPSLFDLEIFYLIDKEKTFKIVPLSFVEKYQDKTAKYEGSLMLESSGKQGVNVRLLPSDKRIQMLYPDLIKWQELKNMALG
jgi:starch phosphorylase